MYKMNVRSGREEESRKKMIRRTKKRPVNIEYEYIIETNRMSGVYRTCIAWVCHRGKGRNIKQKVNDMSWKQSRLVHVDGVQASCENE